MFSITWTSAAGKRRADLPVSGFPTVALLKRAVQQAFGPHGFNDQVREAADTSSDSMPVVPAPAVLHHVSGDAARYAMAHEQGRAYKPSASLPQAYNRRHEFSTGPRNCQIGLYGRQASLCGLTAIDVSIR